MFKAEDYQLQDPTWCKGCGLYVQHAVKVPFGGVPLRCDESADQGAQALGYHERLDLDRLRGVVVRKLDLVATV